MSPRPLQNLPTGEQELQLIERLRAGDRAAQTEVVRRYQGRLRQQAFKILNDRALAEDVVQDTWVVVLASVGRFEGRSALLSWLTGIVINRARDFRRRQSRVRQLSSMGQPPSSRCHPDGCVPLPGSPRARDGADGGAHGPPARAGARPRCGGPGAPGDATVRRASPAARLRPGGDEGSAADHRPCQARAALAGPLPSPRGARQVRGLREETARVRKGSRIAGSRTLRRAVPFAALLFVLVAAHTLLETARDSLFLTRQPISHLPIVFLAVTATVLALTPLQRLLWSTGHRGALPITLLGTGTITLIFWLGTGHRGAVAAFYVWTALFSSLVFVQFWLAADEAFALGDAKRTFGFIAAGGLLGAVAGSAGARLLLHACAPVLLLPASAAVTFAAVILALIAVPRVGTGSRTEPVAVVTRAVPAVLREDPYLRLLAGLTLLTAASATLLDYLFKAAIVAGTAPARIRS